MSRSEENTNYRQLKRKKEIARLRKRAKKKARLRENREQAGNA